MIGEDANGAAPTEPDTTKVESVFESPQWLQDLLQPLEANPWVYAAVVGGGLLVLLWLIHLFFRFLVVRPLAGSGIFDLALIPVSDLVQTMVIPERLDALSIVVGVAVQLLPDLDRSFMTWPTGR